MSIVPIILLLNFLIIFVMMRRKAAKVPDEPEYSFQAPPGYIIVTQESTLSTNTSTLPKPQTGALVAKACNIILGICFIFSLLALLLM